MICVFFMVGRRGNRLFDTPRVYHEVLPKLLIHTVYLCEADAQSLSKKRVTRPTLVQILRNASMSPGVIQIVIPILSANPYQRLIVQYSSPLSACIPTPACVVQIRNVGRVIRHYRTAVPQKKISGSTSTQRSGIEPSTVIQEGDRFPPLRLRAVITR